MRQVTGYWVDGRGNRWHCGRWSESEAVGESVRCNDCYDCYDCTNCTNCTRCNGCNDFSINPQRIGSPRLGSRQSCTVVYWVDEGKEQVVCGCFRGDLAQFKEAVMKKHGDSSTHGMAYLHWIEKVQSFIGGF